MPHTLPIDMDLFRLYDAQTWSREPALARPKKRNSKEYMNVTFGIELEFVLVMKDDSDTTISWGEPAPENSGEPEDPQQRQEEQRDALVATSSSPQPIHEVSTSSDWENPASQCVGKWGEESQETWEVQPTAVVPSSPWPELVQDDVTNGPDGELQTNDSESKEQSEAPPARRFSWQLYNHQFGSTEIVDHSGMRTTFSNSARPIIEGWLKGAGLHIGSYDYEYKSWTVIGDGSVKFESPRKLAIHVPVQEYRSFGAEVISRVMDYSSSWEEEIRKAVCAIQRGQSEDAIVMVNPSGGLHLHVGDGNNGLRFETIQKAMLIVVGFERLIDLMHDSYRISNGIDFCRTNYFMSPSALLWYNSRYEFDLAAHLPLIKDAQTWHELQEAIASNGKCSSYNISRQNSVDTISTIEFRQHAATFDAERIISWVHFGAQLVRFANDRSIDEIFEWVLCRCTDLDYSLMDFLEHLEVSKQCKLYYADRISEQTQVQLRASGWLETRDQFGKLQNLVHRSDCIRLDRTSSDATSRVVQRKMRKGVYGFNVDGNGKLLAASRSETISRDIQERLERLENSTVVYYRKTENVGKVEIMVLFALFAVITSILFTMK